MKKIMALVLGTLSLIGGGNASEYVIGNVLDAYSSFEQNEIRRASCYSDFLKQELDEGVYEKFQNKQQVNWIFNSCEYSDTCKYPNTSLTEPIEKRSVTNYGRRNDECLQFDTDYLIPAIIVTTQVDDEESAIKRYNDPNSRESLHFLIRPDAKIVECVPLSKRAWGGFDINTVNNYEFKAMMDVYSTTEGSPADVCGIYIGLIRGNDFNSDFIKQVETYRVFIKMLQGTFKISEENIFTMPEVNNHALHFPRSQSASSSTTELVTSSDSDEAPSSLTAEQKRVIKNKHLLEKQEASKQGENSPSSLTAKKGFPSGGGYSFSPSTSSSGFDSNLF